MGGVLTGTLSGGGAMTGSMAAGMVANKKPGTYTVTPETLAKILKMAEPGATIKLSPGEYGRIDLHGQNAYPEDCTFIGCEGATVAGVSITSGVKSDALTADVSSAILPQGLTFKNVIFIDNFSLRNARVDNLTIDGCTLKFNAAITKGGNIFINPEGFKDSYGDDVGSGTVYRHQYAQLKQKNLTIKDCVIEKSTAAMSEGGGNASAIHVLGVDGVTIDNNTIGGSRHNGIQVGGHLPDYNVVSSGKISIVGNTIVNTQDRGINVHSIKNGHVTIAENALVSDCLNFEHRDAIIVRYCEETTLSWFTSIDSAKYNTYAGNNIEVGSSVYVSVVSVIPVSEATQTALDLKADAAEMQTALDGKAPAGYGLGENCIHVESINEITKSGYYKLYAEPADDAVAFHAVAYDENNIDLSSNILHRAKLGGVWGEWEWVNPPMVLFQEYRTTELCEVNPVYTMEIYCGTLTHGGEVTIPTDFQVIRYAARSDGFIPYPYDDADSTYHRSVRIQCAKLTMLAGSNADGTEDVLCRIWYFKN